MATKPPAKKPAQSLTVSESPLYSISQATQLIASEIPLPVQYSIIYARFSPIILAQQYQDVDSARKLIFDTNHTLPFLSSTLTYVDVSNGLPSLWAFYIEPNGVSEGSLSINPHFEKLSFQGLHREFKHSFVSVISWRCSLSLPRANMILLQAQMRADLHFVRFTLALRHVRNGGILALAVLHCKRLRNTSMNLH